MDELLKYVNEQLAKGYTPTQVRDALIRHGYSPALVEGVMESVTSKRTQSPLQSYSPPQRASLQTSPGSGKLIVGIVAVIIILALAFLAPAFLKPKQALLDVMTTADKEAYSPGEEVGFDLQIFNMGSKDRFDITLSYRLLDASDGLVTSKEETIAISTSTSYHKSIKLPVSTKPGDYTLKVFANYDGKVATSAFSFKTEPKPITDSKKGTCSDDVKNQDEVGVDCGGVCGGYYYDNSCNDKPEDGSEPEIKPEPKKPTCDDGVKNQDETGIDCGGLCGGYWYDLSCHAVPKPASAPTGTAATQSNGARLLELRLKAKTDPEGAKTGCLEFTDEKFRDSCLKAVAQASGKNEYCELIIADSDRDLCYYPFFMQGDYTVCDKLVLKESLQTCAQLKQIAAISQLPTNPTPPPEQP